MKKTRIISIFAILILLLVACSPKKAGPQQITEIELDDEGSYHGPVIYTSMIKEIPTDFNTLFPSFPTAKPIENKDDLYILQEMIGDMDAKIYSNEYDVYAFNTENQLIHYARDEEGLTETTEKLDILKLLQELKGAGLLPDGYVIETVFYSDILHAVGFTARAENDYLNNIVNSFDEITVSVRNDRQFMMFQSKFRYKTEEGVPQSISKARKNMEQLLKEKGFNYDKERLEFLTYSTFNVSSFDFMDEQIEKLPNKEYFTGISLMLPEGTSYVYEPINNIMLRLQYR